MFLEKLAPAWRDFQQKLLAHTCVLVVDDEPVIQELLSELLTGEGFTVRRADNATEAWVELTTSRIDLAVIDKNLPDESGLSIIRRIRDENLAVPTVLITGYATTETVAEALDAGASDYISKPFDDISHLMTRIRGVLDRRITQLLFDIMVRDLTRAASQGEQVEEANAYSALSRELLAFKLGLGRRTQIIIIDEDDGAADELSRAMQATGVSSIIAENQAELLGIVGTADGPLVVALALELPRATELIAALRARDPQIEILATAIRGNLRQALTAVSSGAADYALRATEGEAALSARLLRLLQRARRHRLYLHLIATLYRAAKAANPDLAEDIIFAAPGADAGALEGSPPAVTDQATTEKVGDLRSDYIEGTPIEGNPLGSKPLHVSSEK